jgi:hypothetical protein
VRFQHRVFRIVSHEQESPFRQCHSGTRAGVGRPCSLAPGNSTNAGAQSYTPRPCGTAFSGSGATQISKCQKTNRRSRRRCAQYYSRDTPTGFAEGPSNPRIETCPIP